MASGNGVAVGITDGFGGRAIYTSTDGRHWSHAATSTNTTLLRVRFLNGMFVGVGVNDAIWTSVDGSDWMQRHTDFMKAALFDVAYGNGVTVAVGYNAEILASTDLKKWAPISGLGSAYSFTHVEFGNGRFVAIGAGHVFASTDGFTWTENPWPAGADYSASALAFNNGFFAFSSGQIFTSLDGAHWKASSGAQFGKIVSVPGGFLGVWPTISKSADGANWEELLDYAGDYSDNLSAATELDGKLIVGGTHGLLFVADDGERFDQIVNEEIDYSHSKIAFGNQTFVRYGNLRAGVDLSSDGASWESISNTPAFRSVVFGNGGWVGVAVDGSIFSSTDARTWTSVSAPLAGTEARFGNGLFIVETAQASVEISRDGKAWKQVDVAGAQFVKVIGNLNGRWAAIVNYHQPATSEDGENWTLRPAQDGLQGAVFATGNGRFLAIGGGGMGPGAVAWSSNGIDWQSQRLTSGTTHMEQSLNFGGGQFVLTDNYGDAYSSDDGINWIGGRQAEQPFLASAYGQGRWLLAGGDSVLRSSSVRQASVGIILELKQQSFSNWSLTVQGSVGDQFSIETTSALGGQWSPVQVVQIPLAGRLQVAVTGSPNAAFFRAVSVLH